MMWRSLERTNSEIDLRYDWRYVAGFYVGYLPIFLAALIQLSRQR
jgi:hypothetical protein